MKSFMSELNKSFENHTSDTYSRKGLTRIKSCWTEKASNLTFLKCLHLVDLNNPQIIMTDDKMAVPSNI